MSESRPHLGVSFSFSGESTSQMTRSLKRRLASTPELPFFTPAATSFKPKPYAPHNASNPVTRMLPPTRTQSMSSLAQHIPVMDPSPLDPYVVFLHPPFDSFPDSHLYPDGLTYALLAQNLEWFLDAKDFISGNNSNENAVPYPPQLEPPRGWCPSKKKDLKTLGPDGWPEGEEPRLRCTFCRRTYAGVNAKSMWRRHVYEKHKIAMANRRDGHDRSRGGRGSNKEYRQQTAEKENQAEDKKEDKAQSHIISSVSSKSKFRALLSPSPLNKWTDKQTKLHRNAEDMAVLDAPVIEQQEFPQSPISHDISRAHPLASSTLPVANTPPGSPLSSAQVAEENQSSPKSPTIISTFIPQSPYDPLQTPSFRHSPPRLPSDQPWRFPSPSHPLHSRARELSLSMLVRDGFTPTTKGMSMLQSSPASTGPATAANSPTVNIQRKKKDLFEEPTIWDSSPSIFRPSPRQVIQGRSPISAIQRMDFVWPINDSPLNRRFFQSQADKKTSLKPTDMRDSWLSDISIPSPMSLGSKSRLSISRVTSSEDPFEDLYSPLITSDAEVEASKSSLILPGESPVIRNAALPATEAPALGADLIGLGIGLLAPFSLPGEDQAETQGMLIDDDFNDSMSARQSVEREEVDEAEVESALAESERLQDEKPYKMDIYMVDTKSEAYPLHDEAPFPSRKRRKTIHSRD